ncbi:MAG: acetyltransferase [Clostridium sp.]|nr:acetyltransferase [Clostridium sp.]
MGIVILGAGGHAGVIVDLIEAAMGRNHPGGGISLLDDSIPSGTMVYGYRVEGKISDCMRYPSGTEFIIGIGDNGMRGKIAAEYELNYITLVHPGAVIAGNVSLGKGTVVMAGAVVGRGTRIGEHCIINTGATVDHACVLGDFVHISPGAHLGGEVRIGDGSWLGIGSCVRQGIEVGKDVTAGAGAAVVKNIEEKGIYTGIPAKKAQDENINTGK